MRGIFPSSSVLKNFPGISQAQVLFADSSDIFETFSGIGQKSERSLGDQSFKS